METYSAATPRAGPVAEPTRAGVSCAVREGSVSGPARLSMPDAIAVLERIAATLERIEVLLASTPKAKRPKPKGEARYRTMIAEAREQATDQTPIRTVVALWQEICPHHPQPLEITVDRAERIRGLWAKFGGADGIRNLFLTVAGNDWLCGKPVGGRPGAKFSRPRGAAGLWEVIANAVEIIEGTYR